MRLITSLYAEQFLHKGRWRGADAGNPERTIGNGIEVAMGTERLGYSEQNSCGMIAPTTARKDSFHGTSSTKQHIAKFTSSPDVTEQCFEKSAEHRFNPI